MLREENLRRKYLFDASPHQRNNSPHFAGSLVINRRCGDLVHRLDTNCSFAVSMGVKNRNRSFQKSHKPAFDRTDLVALCMHSECFDALYKAYILIRRIQVQSAFYDFGIPGLTTQSRTGSRDQKKSGICDPYTLRMTVNQERGNCGRLILLEA